MAMAEKNANKGKIVKYEAGEVIITEGEHNTEMFKIIQGFAEMYMGYGTDQEVLLGIIGKQKFFGEFGLLIGQPSIYTVVAYMDTYVLRVSEDEMEDFIRDNNKSVLDLLRNMANSMLTMSTHIDLLTSDLVEAQKLKPEEAKQDEKEKMREYVLYKPGGIGLHGKMHLTPRYSKEREERRSRFDIKA